MAFFSLFRISRRPEEPVGYDWMMARNGGEQFDYDPPEMEKETQLCAQWVSRWQSSLTFFSKELDSEDARRVRTGIACLVSLAMGMDMTQYSEASPITTSDRAQFASQFPVEKLKQILTEHPEYDPWVSAIRFTSLAQHFPEPDEPDWAPE